MIDATELISDEIAEKILLSSYNVPITVKEISARYDIPIAECYKKAKLLEEKGLIQVTETLKNGGGRERKLYQSNLDDAYVFFNNGKLKVRFEVALGMVRDFRMRWERHVASMETRD